MPRGAAGGPLLDASGRVLGINALLRPGGLVLALLAGEDLRARVDALARGESRARAELGVAVAPPRAPPGCGAPSASRSARPAGAGRPPRAAPPSAPASGAAT